MKKIGFVLIASMFLLMMSINVKAQSSEQNVIIEVFTGNWVGFAPDAAVVLEEVLLYNPNVFAINIHQDDEMSFSYGEYVVGFYTSAYPTAVINRDNGPVIRDDWMIETQALLSETSVVDVSFDSIRYNPDNGLLDVYLKASFTGAASGDLRFNCILVEDHVTGEWGYSQVNYANDEVGHEYYGAGDPIIGFDHRYVAREFLGGSWGESESIPYVVTVGDEFTHHFSTTVPEEYNYDELSLLATVNRYDGDGLEDRKILNVERLSLTDIPEPIAGFEQTANNICKGGAITYTNTSSDATTFSWTFEGGEPASSNLGNPGPITYPYGGVFNTLLVAQNSTGNDITHVVINVDSVNAAVSVVGNTLIAADENANYQWFNCNGGVIPIDGETSQEFAFEETGFYSVEVDIGSCVDMSICYSVTFGSVDGTALSNLNIYPNPSNGDIKIESQEKGDLIISDLRGQQVYISTLNKGVNEFSLQLSQGLYIITISSNKGIVTKKLIIE